MYNLVRREGGKFITKVDGDFKKANDIRNKISQRTGDTIDLYQTF